MRIAALKEFISASNHIFFSLNLECNRGAKSPTEKCPVQIADLVLLHNVIVEAINKPANEINDKYDFWNAARQLKAPYLKYCNLYQNRVRVALADYRVIPDEEQGSTSAKIKGMVLEWKSRKTLAKQEMGEMTLELQFLEHHKKQYLELSADFANNSFMPQSKTALENFKELVLLDLKILMGADIAWQRPGRQPDHPAELAVAALSPGGTEDDRSGTSSDEAAADNKAAPSQSSAKDAPAPVSAAPDPTNFLTWTPQNWETVAFDQIRFPADQSPFKTRAYFAVALLFLHKVALRVKHSTVWTELTEAWKAIFGSPLSKESLVQPPAGGSYAFSDEEQQWCEQTLRYFGAGGRAPSPPAREGAVGRRTSGRRPAQVKAANPPAADGGSLANAGGARKAAAAAAAAVPVTPSR